MRQNRFTRICLDKDIDRNRNVFPDEDKISNENRFER